MCSISNKNKLPQKTTYRMQKILTTSQIRAIDADTIQYAPMESIALMERAAQAFVGAFCQDFPNLDVPIVLLCGTGNNGGDGWAAARLLQQRGYEVTVWAADMGVPPSADNWTNQTKVRTARTVHIVELTESSPLPIMADGTIVIDALFGSGLSRPLQGFWANCIGYLNTAAVTRIAIDMPSGLFADKANAGNDMIFQASRTYAFQLPKLAFFAPENAPFVGDWTLLDIGLLPSAIAAQPATSYLLDADTLAALLRSRGRFDHKGTYGHALIVAGSFGKMGAALLSAKAALRAGCGLVTMHVPRCGYEIAQIAFPEAMVEVDRHRQIWTETPRADRYQAIGIGPGLGTDGLTAQALAELLHQATCPLVLDADALNMIAAQTDLLNLLPPDSLLTPHPKEFERLFGSTPNSFDRWKLLRQKAQSLRCFILLKGGNSVVATPDGHLYFSTVGNPGMATAGAGDVLTGIISGLLAQGYTAKHAMLLGVYLHGLAGDLAAEAVQMESIIAEDIIAFLGAAFRTLRTRHTSERGNA